MLAIFVWTFTDVLNAVGLGLVLLAFAYVGLLIAWIKLLEWWGRKKKRKT